MDENLEQTETGSRFTKKKIISLVALVLLLLSIPIGVYLVQVKQIFKSKASSLTQSILPGAGDLKADIILGQPDFGENTPGEIVSFKVAGPGGVIVDRNSHPNRVYVYDGMNSRVLGFSSLGVCKNDGSKKCSVDSECPNSTCDLKVGGSEGQVKADLVLGQPDFNHSACNGDGTYHNQPYPVRTPAGKATLCGLSPGEKSPYEGGSMGSMAVDQNHNLYVPDIWNNRVLKYNDPYSSDKTDGKGDSIADEIWGQDSDSASACNKGQVFPNASTLCLENNVSGVEIDPVGNLWVADSGNNRVLRFSKNPQTGQISKTADLVLGQDNFTSNGSGNNLNQLSKPAAVKAGSDGKVYVADPGSVHAKDQPFINDRVMVYETSSSVNLNNGMSGRVFAQMYYPTGLEFDIQKADDSVSGGIWINDTWHHQVILLGFDGQPKKVLSQSQPVIGHVAAPEGTLLGDARGSIGLTSDGDLIVSSSGGNQDVYLYKHNIPPYPGAPLSASSSKVSGKPLRVAGGGNSMEYNFGSAAKFDGETTYISIPQAKSLPNLNSDFTIEFWIKPGKTRPWVGRQGILDKPSGNPSLPEYVISRLSDTSADNDGPIVFGIGEGWDSWILRGNTYLKTDGSKWYHVAVVSKAVSGSNSRNFKLFIDGLIDAERTIDRTFTEDKEGSLLIGGKINTNQSLALPFSGLLDELRISNTARYTNNFGTEISPFNPDGYTLALWHFDGDLRSALNNSAQEGSYFGIMNFINRATGIVTTLPPHLPTPTPTLWPYQPAVKFFSPPEGHNYLSNKGFSSPRGIVVSNNQLIVADGYRIMYWNTPNGITDLSNNKPADGVAGVASFTATAVDPPFWKIANDNLNNLWAIHGSKLERYKLPLTSGRMPSLTIDTQNLKILGQGSTINTYLEMTGIYADPQGRYLWLATSSSDRVFRIRIPANKEDVSGYVIDAIIGGDNFHAKVIADNGSGWELPCNGHKQDGTPYHPGYPGSLCYPGAVGEDKEGNLYISDFSFEQAGSGRFFRLDKRLFPLNGSAPLIFPDVENVQLSLSTGGTVKAGEKFCNIKTSSSLVSEGADRDCKVQGWDFAFDSFNRMVMGFSYHKSRFPLVFNNPQTLIGPNLNVSNMVGDFYTQAVVSKFDAAGNLYIADSNAGRVLIYNKPYQATPVCQSLLDKVNQSQGASCGDPKYDFVADINIDRKVDDADIELFNKTTGNGTRVDACTNYLGVTANRCYQPLCADLDLKIKESSPSSCQDAKYKAAADINKDGVINQKDSDYLRETSNNLKDVSVCKKYQESISYACAVSQTFEFPNTPGAKFIVAGLILDKGADYKAEDFLKDLNDKFQPNIAGKKINFIRRFSTTASGISEDHSFGSTENNFPIEAGSAYAIYADSAGKATLTGTLPQSYNLHFTAIPVTVISLPQLPPGVNTASDLVNFLKSKGLVVTSVVRFDINQSYGVDAPPFAGSVNFVLKTGQGYSLSRQINEEKVITIDTVSSPSAQSVSVKFVCTACTADIKKDGYVNGADVSYFSTCFNKKASDKDSKGVLCENRDINKDGAVNLKDLDCVRSQFLKQCSR